MDELNFKFIYSGQDSFLDLMEYLRFNSGVDRPGRYWKGIVKTNGKNFLRVEGKYFIGILFKIIWELGDDKNDTVMEMNLFSP